MVLEKGGRADKFGNIYELNCAIYKLLDVVSEELYSVTLEPLGYDEMGTDIRTVDKNGNKSLIQCKSSNGEKADWSISDLKSRNILKNWVVHLSRDVNNKVEILSPCSATILESLVIRAKNTGTDSSVFYNSQVCSNASIKKGYEDFCKGVSISIDNNSNTFKNEIAKSIDYLKRISVIRRSNKDLLEIIYLKIGTLFSSEKNKVYNVLKAIFDTGDNFGREITLVILKKLFDKEEIYLRTVEEDGKVFQRLCQINEYYKRWSSLIDDSLIDRPEFERCITLLTQEKSFVISGQAGMGKSGCTEAIINHCEEFDIPYIAIKLDRSTPEGSITKWSHALEFPYSFVEVLDRLSHNTQAVIILDQLDALRWTFSYSRQALNCCMEVIENVNILNKIRNKKICIVFVCRKYDLENDNNIKALFESKNGTNDIWTKIEIGRLNEETVKRITGDHYDNMSPKMKALIAIPSNLYIWEKISDKGKTNACSTTGKLIEEWYNQIIYNWSDSEVIKYALNEIVDKLENNSRFFLPKVAFDIDNRAYEYLVSSGLLIDEKDKIGFVHQSMLDYFVSKKMLKQFYDRVDVEHIIGNAKDQTPIRRYQVLMFLQGIIEGDTKSFVSVAETILCSNSIRFYYKHLIYECLGLVDQPDKNICNFIINQIGDWNNIAFLLNNVIYGKIQYVRLLLDNGILEKWYEEKDKKDTVFNILRSVSRELSLFGIGFIKKRIFCNEEDDKKFAYVIQNDCFYDNDEMFSLRLCLYKKYPALLKNLYLDIKKANVTAERRIIQLIVFWLSNREYFVRNNVSSLLDFIYENNEYIIEDGKFVLDNMLKFVPEEANHNIIWSDWSERHFSNYCSERLIMDLLKKATENIIATEPKLFWNYYKPYLGKGFYLYDELILYGLGKLPKCCSNDVMLYICRDFNQNIYDKTSGSGDKLGFVKEAIKVHSDTCSPEVFEIFEKKLIKHISCDAVDRFKMRKQIKSYYNECIYQSFWGELQYELLKVLSQNRLSDYSKELIDVLKRKFGNKKYLYLNDDNNFGTVKSPVTGKKLSNKQWLQIITNNKIADRRHGKWKEDASGFVESSVDMFASDFTTAVSNTPNTLVELVLDNYEFVLPEYISSLMNGVAYSDNIDQVEGCLLENLFQKIDNSFDYQRVIAFCGIIEKKCAFDWSSSTIRLLLNFALNGFETEKELLIADTCDSRRIFNDSINSIRGHALRAMEMLITSRESLLEFFKEYIEQLSASDNSSIKMSLLFPLWPCYNIDKEWAGKIILRLYESDIRLVRFPYSKTIFLNLFHFYRDRILNLVKRCFDSDEEYLMQVGSTSLCELYFKYDCFNEVFSCDIIDEKRAKFILVTAVHFLKSEYKTKAKNVIVNLIDAVQKPEFAYAHIFDDDALDLYADKDFIIKVLESRWRAKSVHYFIRYLEKNGYSLKGYGDIILKLCNEVINEQSSETRMIWSLPADLSKLVISLYDECVDGNNPEDIDFVEKCLDIWDIMFKKQIGYTRELSQQIMER